VASVERTAYLRFKRTISARVRQEAPTAESCRTGGASIVIAHSDRALATRTQNGPGSGDRRCGRNGPWESELIIPSSW
jgi:hypothetical protein